MLHDYRGDVDEAEPLSRRAVELFQAAGDEIGRLLATPTLSAVLRGLGRLDEAWAVDRAPVAAARRPGVADIVLARCLNALAMTGLLAGEFRQAHAAAAESVTLLRTAGNRYVLVAALRQLACAATGLGRRAEAVRLLAESHDLAVALGDRLWATSLHRDVAVSWIGDGRPAAAVPVFQRCLLVFEELGLRAARVATLRMLARAHDALGEDRAAARARRAAVALADPRDSVRRCSPTLSCAWPSRTEPVVPCG